jgi:hypothetical protein
MKLLCNFYIKHAGIIGAAYCLIPNIIWFMGAFIFGVFREVYLIRLVISLLIGCPLTGYLNRYGVEIWLCKHGSQKGPATMIDGILIGSAVGFGSAILPTLSVFINSSNFERAKTIIIITYLTVTCLGGILGLTLSIIAQKYLNEKDIITDYPI